MKRKGIKFVLKRQFDAWLATITDAKLVKKIKEDGFVTGGAIPSLLLGETLHDLDVYFRTRGTALAVAQYYVTQSAKEATKNESKPKFRPVSLTTNAITLSHGIQIVIRFFGSPEEIHANCDFIHCTCVYDYKSGEVSLPPAALESILGKFLIYKGGSKYPLCSIIRTRKFVERGWKCDAGQYVKMAWDLNQLNLNDIGVLEDQMVGVYAAYFEEVLAILRAGKEAGKELSGTYLMEVIDRVFGTEV